MKRIRRMRVPVLVIAGGHDTIVPLEQSRQVYKGAADPKTLVVLPGADHNDLALLAGGEMIASIVRFIELLPKR